MNSFITNKDLEASQATDRLPPFDKSRPAEWFVEIEKHFENFHVVNDSDKLKLLYDKLDGALQKQVHIMMLFGAMVGNKSYELIKTFILNTLRDVCHW